jgi:hypothetical protein
MADTKKPKGPVGLEGKDSADATELKLDMKNPRFAAYSGSKRSEKDIIRYLLESADLRELVESIAANGYVNIEPLVVLDEDKDGKLTVIEGNRRAAAIKLLRNPELAAELGVTLPTMNDQQKESLKRASILKVESRDQARQYIGFKHINGPHKWDSFAKGQFAAEWYRKERANGLTIRDIASRLGDRHDTILRLVNGIYVLDQAKKNKLFALEDRFPGRPFFFSHLYTALTRPQFRDYLGLPHEWRNLEPEPDPIPEKNLPRLVKLLTWLFGSAEDEIEPLVKSQNPHVKQLGEVLASPMALKRLEANEGLSKAFAEVDSRGKQFEEALIRSVRYGEDAQKLVDAYEGDEALVEYGGRLEKIGNNLVRTMKAFDGDAGKKAEKK